MLTKLFLSYPVLLALAAILSQSMAYPWKYMVPRDEKKFVQFGVNVVRDNVDLTPAKLYGASEDAVAAPIANLKYHYNIDLEFGSNKQKITVSVDTGSSDLWVVSNDATCQNNVDCKSQGTYAASQSNTSKNLNQPFLLTYIDRTSTSGTYYLDQITIPGGTTVNQVQFADANTTSSPFGVLGIGLNSTEAPVFSDDSNAKVYPNFPWALKNQGIIDRAAYSLYLNKDSALSGILLLGGIDQAKYEGQLTKYSGAFPSRLGVKMDTVNANGNQTNPSTGFVLDSGYSYSAWPKATADAIGSALSGSYFNSQLQNWIANCSQPDETISLGFNGGSQQISVPYSAFLTTQQVNSTHCYSTILYSSDGSDYNNLPTLGDDVLRSFYVVYDIEDNTLQIAQAVHTDLTDIVPITD